MFCFLIVLVQNELTNNAITTSRSSATVNSERQQRAQSINRQQLDDTIRRLSKPKTIPTIESVHNGTTISSSTNGIPLSQFNHQLRVPGPSVTTNHHLTKTLLSSNSRRVS